MKIGILTLPLHTNYGGILQAYALHVVLKRLGHDVKVINKNRQPKRMSLYQVSKSFIRRIISTIVHRKRYKFYNINNEQKSNYADFLLMTQHTQKFVDKYIDCFYVRNYQKDIKKTTFDAIVVGSDQIWSREHGGAIDGNVANAYLPFFIDKHPLRISYAASFGKDYWEYTKKQEIIARNAISRFTAVSVREQSGIKLCKDHFGVDAIQLLDPTLLLKAEDYISDIDLENVSESPGNMLVYIIDGNNEKDSIVSLCENKLNLKRFIVNSRAEDYNIKDKALEDCIQPPVEQWLRGFYDAKFVVTDSFHACVFSILFHKPFIIVGNESRGNARFVSLLSLLHLSEHLVHSLQDVNNIDIKKQIDFTIIDSILEKEREKAFKYLKTNLS